MFNCLTGAETWRKSLDKFNFYNNNILLSDSLCAVVYSNVKKFEHFNTYASGDFLLLLLDTETGKELHSGTHWDFNLRVRDDSPLGPLPVMAVNEEFLCALSAHSCYYVNDYGYDPEDGVVGFKKESSNTFVCVKYKSGSCNVIKVHTSLEHVLLAKCREARLVTGSKGQNRFGSLCCNWRGGFVKVKSLALHGIVGGTVVVGDVRFDYVSDNCGPAFKDVATVFTLDLNVIFDTCEPAAAFAAIAFPLKGDMLLEKPEDFGFRPYYRSGKGSTALAGLVSFEGKKQPESVTIHSFKTALEWTSFDKKDI